MKKCAKKNQKALLDFSCLIYKREILVLCGKNDFFADFHVLEPFTPRKHDLNIKPFYVSAGLSQGMNIFHFIWVPSN
jgi:hypothetical protein